MVKLYLFSLCVIVLALLLSLYFGFPSDPGYLLIAFANYTFETSLFALFVAAIVIYLVIKLILIVLRWINPLQLIRIGKNYKEQRKANARSRTTEGMLYFTRGNWESSYNLLKKGMKDSDASIVNYLAAAYAAYQQGNKEEWMNCLKLAEDKYPSALSTINSLRAQLLFKSNQLEQCVALLQQMKTSSLNDSSLLQLLKEVYLRLKDWKQLEGLLPVLEKNNVIDNEEAEQIRVRIFMENLYVISNSRADFSDSQIVEQLGAAWKKAAAPYKQDERIVKHYAEILYKLDQKEQAAKVIEVTLDKNWSDELVTLYGELDFGASERQLQIAERWIKNTPKSARLFLALGRLAMRSELWGKAREYFNTSIELESSADAHGEFARLLKALGEEKLAEVHQEKFLIKSGVELIELPLPQIVFQPD